MTALPPGLDRLPSGKIRARYRDAEGRQHSKSFPPRGGIRAAQAWLRDQRSTVDAGTHVAPNDRTTVRDFAERWARSRPHRESTRRQVVTYLRHLDETPLGARPLRLVRPSEVQEFISNRNAAGYAPQTVRNLYTWIRAVFSAAVEDRLILHTPCTRKIVLPKLVKDEIVPLTVEQVRALAEAMEPRYAAGVLLQAATGVRISELLALQVRDVDFLRRTVRVERQLSRNGREFVEPKSEHGYRTIPLATEVVEALSQHVAAYPPNEDGVLLTTTHGNPIRQDLFTCVQFRRAAQVAGLSDVTPHDLRHHFASVLLMMGLPTNVVAKYLGHGSSRLVEETYGHVMPGADDLARGALDTLWGQPGEAPSRFSI
ncbi:tyrosine-type recombinase/integrase [Nocardioides sp. GXQ0305]|uniref:tyrosine-type recombinase/integrase n=1 Tax=Nocardioides sp. GXQ0305 TaxID=3423912 RepID=UPI003D7C9EC8